MCSEKICSISYFNVNHNLANRIVNEKFSIIKIYLQCVVTRSVIFILYLYILLMVYKDRSLREIDIFVLIYYELYVLQSKFKSSI